MAVFVCDKCGASVDTRCKPKKCSQCGESNCLTKAAVQPAPTKEKK